MRNYSKGVNYSRALTIWCIREIDESTIGIGAAVLSGPSGTGCSFEALGFKITILSGGEV